MPRRVRGLLEAALLTLGALTVGAIGLKLIAGRANRTQSHQFEQNGCRFSVNIDVSAWRPEPYLVNAYASIPDVRGRTTYLGFPAGFFGHDVYDARRCIASKHWKGSNDAGQELHLTWAQCAQSMPSTPGSEPPGTYRLYGVIEGHHLALGAALYASHPESLEVHRPDLVAMLKSLKVSFCGAQVSLPGVPAARPLLREVP